MKKLLILIITICLVNCSDKKEDKTIYKNHEIPFLNASIKLPENYDLITLEEYGEIIKNNYSDTLFIKNKLLSIEQFKLNHIEYLMFCDNENIDNNITIVPAINPTVNEWVKEKLADYIISSMRDRGNDENFKYKNLQNKLIDERMIKIKGKIVYDKTSEKGFYSTQYLANGWAIGFSAFVNNSSDVDFEKELTEIKYN